MRRSWAIGALYLFRIPSTLVAFLLVFLPTYVHTQDPHRSLAASAPLALISICIFILNDLNDIERDRLNHPGRPLPSGLLSPQVAATLYLTTFLICLGLLQFFIEVRLRYVYYAGFLIAINYSIAVEYLPKLKTVYVAVCATLPLILVSMLTNSPPNAAVVAGAFAFVLGREFLMDLRDIRGDGATAVKLLSSETATGISFCLQGIGLIGFASTASSILQRVATIVALALFVFILMRWPHGPRAMLLQLMKIQMLCAVAFLF